MSPTIINETGISTLLPFFDHLVSELRALHPRLDEVMQVDGERVVAATAKLILPPVYALAAGFPFLKLLEPSDDGLQQLGAEKVIAPYVATIVAGMKCDV
jgi:hypothetical protein